MPAFDMTAADPLMKIKFDEAIRKQFSTSATLWNRAAKGKGVGISNRGLEIPLHMSEGADHGFFADGGILPAGSGPDLAP